MDYQLQQMGKATLVWSLNPPPSSNSVFSERIAPIFPVRTIALALG